MGDIEDYIFDEDGIPILRSPSVNRPDDKFADEEDVTNIFHHKSEGFDVTLSLSRGLITWTNVNPSGKKKGMFKGKKLDKQTVMLKDVFGVRMKRRRPAGQDSGEGACLGFSVFVADQIGPSCLADKVIFFEHPSESLCSMYTTRIERYLAEIEGRPKAIKLFLQTHAGSKNGRILFKTRVSPIFEAAKVSVECIELHHNEHIKQEMIHINIQDYDCVVAMGGDGSASMLVDGLLSHIQKDKDIEMKPGFSPVRSPIPVGIIPVGTTNHIARSVMGTEDLVTSVLHIVMGHKQSVDICSTYSEDRFLNWCFNCQYGFAGNILAFRKRYKAVGKRGLEPAFVKALTKAKLRPYKCDIEYIPADPISKNRRFLPCWKGCDVCWNEKVSDGDEVTCDLVEAFDPLSTSNDSETLVDLAEHEDNPWRTVKGDYLNIGLYTIPGRSDMAPRGLSKYTHLNDGVIELVLVKDVERKEFIRMLKRLGNSKNQFDFPFIEVIRVKEVRFRLRLPTGFNYNDYNFSEIDYEMSRQQKKMSSANKSTEEVLEIDDISDDSDIEEIKETKKKPSTPDSLSSKQKQKPPMRRAESFQPGQKKKELKRTNTEVSMEIELTDSEEEEEEDESSEEIEVNGLGVRTVRSGSAPPQLLVGPQYRMTFADKDRAKRRQRARKKEEKKKAKEQERMKTVWNVDNEIKEADTIDFRVHHGLLQICGQGIDPENVYNDSTLLCIPRL